MHVGPTSGRSWLLVHAYMQIASGRGETVSSCFCPGTNDHNKEKRDHRAWRNGCSEWFAGSQGAEWRHWWGSPERRDGEAASWTEAQPKSAWHAEE
jgi:hypothetical protein